jgi:hypothetical protein
LRIFQKRRITPSADRPHALLRPTLGAGLSPRQLLADLPDEAGQELVCSAPFLKDRLRPLLLGKNFKHNSGAPRRENMDGCPA